MGIEGRLAELNIVLPEEAKVPANISIPFVLVRICGNRAYVSGHLPLNQDGSISDIVGKVGDQVEIDQAYQAARMAGLAMLASLQRELGSLSRITHWVKIFGMVNTAPGFNQTTHVINGCSELLLEVFGEEIGKHSRSAIGVAELPFNVAVEIEAEVEFS